MQKYLTIYHELVKKIQSNQWPESTKLPSENELTEIYSTSRETIRKALNQLAQDGYIQKIRGKGSVVIDTNKFDFPVSGIVSFKELATNLQLPANTIVNELAIVEADQELQSKLNINLRDSVWKVVRARKISGEKVILDKDYFNKDYVPELTREICEDSIYDYLENQLELKISFARKEIVVEEPSEEDRALLDLEGYSNVVVIKSMVYLEDTSLFQYTESRHRPDKFRFVDFARRVK
ncbi:transcriptional regulator, GntR family [Virgibacillus subterraneus]|uniref:Trehalose operon repressor n=1 Tax=Virgibacillus subterraneus TaxID=621109 RepID=A0A1H9IP72_9BACI|nr:trehalose operon repressor [Virgibacillus subterraneus]SEQ76551.1 transcriptional regulator, GntR family [Virgibacillus subterraneus]